MFYADISPQDSTLLSDVVELGPLPSFIQEDKQTRYSFYISTCQGLRFECSSVSEVQVLCICLFLLFPCDIICESALNITGGTERCRLKLQQPVALLQALVSFISIYNIINMLFVNIYFLQYIMSDIHHLATHYSVWSQLDPDPIISWVQKRVHTRFPVPGALGE